LVDKNSYSSVFSTESGKAVLEGVEHAISEYRMDKIFGSGIAVGFSGGADSVMLLLSLYHLKEKYGYSLTAVHVNHSIRGDEALRDEKFAEAFAHALGIPFIKHTADVPQIAKSLGKGLEEAAREVRYAFFESVISENACITSIATAHNSTDNLETLIFNLMRGTGLSGLCGIAPVRGNIVRPLIFVSKETIVKALDEAKIEYVTDSTNFSVEYSRNYIRHTVLPTLKALTPSPEDAVKKVIRNLKVDADYINGIAGTFFANNIKEGRIQLSQLASLHDAPLTRVLSLMIKAHTDAMAEQTHLRKVISLIRRGGAFSYDLPGRVSFVSNGNDCFLCQKDEKKQPLTIKKTYLKHGITVFEEHGFAIGISDDKNDVFSSNVYKISIQARIAFDIINEGVYVRSKEEGDSYNYGGITRKLKRLFTDKKIPQSLRGSIPVICDTKGIVWVPGFGIRDDAKAGDKYAFITVYKKL